MSGTEKPAVGSVWREDYPYTDLDRLVEVVGYAEDGRVVIRNVVPANGRQTKAKTERFGRKGGYLPVSQERVR
jgi:hypothetical protein